MKAIGAVALVQFRLLARQRQVLVLAALLLVLVVALPRALGGDTAVDHARMALAYTLALVKGILALAALAWGGLALATDVDTGRIQVTAAKPARPWHLWAGRWLGIMAALTLLLALSLAAEWIVVPRRLAARAIDPQDLAAARDQVLCARAALAPCAAPGGMAGAGAMIAVPPGGSVGWAFDVPATRGAARPQLQYRLLSSRWGGGAEAGAWFLRTAGRPDAVGVPCASRSGWLETVAWPDPVPGPARVELRYENRNPDAVAVLFDRQAGLEWRVPAGGLGGNLARAGVVLWLRLALLAALGVSAGALFSRPVALVVALAIAALAPLAGFVAGDSAAATPAAPGLAGWLTSGSLRLAQGLDLAAAPLRAVREVAWVADGRWIAWGPVLARLAPALLLYGLFCAGLGCGVLAGRELGAPGAPDLE